MDSKPTVVICPGAWSLHEFYQPVMQAFEAKGLPAVWGGPPGYPEHDPVSMPPMNFDTAHLREQVLKPLVEQGKDVVLFMHSYGGIYGPASVEGLSRRERTANGLEGGIIAMLWIASFVARKGMSTVDSMGLDMENPPDWLDHDPSANMVGIGKEHAKAVLFHDLPEDEAERLASVLPKQPMSCFALPVQYDPYDDPNFQGLFGYVFADADRILPYEFQQKYVEMGGIKTTTVLKGSSHSPHLEQPVHLVERFVNMLEEITKEK